MEHTDFLAALYSPDSAAGITQENNLFGRFAGEWEFDWYGCEPGMEAQHECGEWIFSWILEGRAIQDVWIIPGRDRRNAPRLPKGEYGTTIRFFNDKLQAWNVVWVGPVKSRFHTFVARMEGEEIVMEETSRNDFKMKWIFSDMTDNFFNWRSIISDDNGESWKVVQKMAVRRKRSHGANPGETCGE